MLLGQLGEAKTASVICVCTTPGATALHMTPRRDQASACERVSPTNPALTLRTRRYCLGEDGRRCSFEGRAVGEVRGVVEGLRVSRDEDDARPGLAECGGDAAPDAGTTSRYYGGLAREPEEALELNFDLPILAIKMTPQLEKLRSLVSFATKPRVFILTDITNEPDDAESFCRYLTYANQFHTEDVVAVTSTWLRDKVAPENLRKIVDAYGKVVGNLNRHVHPDCPYPPAEDIKARIRAGPPVYGMKAVGDDVVLSEGGELLRECLEDPNPEPLWVLVWGGVNVLAQVLHRIRDNPHAEALRAKLRVYTISDQDDCGAWIRQQWPDIFYICSSHGWNQYSNATWTGISADVDGGGPDKSVVSHEWIRSHIQLGPLGAEYPSYEYIMEGDTPTFLYLVQNGLGVPEEPSYGSWGGRYVPVNVSAEGVPNRGHFADASDAVTGKDGQVYTTNKATIWRWRNAFQADFAARIQWTLTDDFAKASHHPVISVNGNVGIEPMRIEAEAGSAITLDASESYDPDDRGLAFRWFQYREPSATQTYQAWEVCDVDIRLVNEQGSKIKVSVPTADKSCILARERLPIKKDESAELISTDRRPAEITLPKFLRLGFRIAKLRCKTLPPSSGGAYTSVIHSRDYCHNRRIKCWPSTREPSRCQNCVDFDLVCLYERPVRRGRPLASQSISRPRLARNPHSRPEPRSNPSPDGQHPHPGLSSARTDEPGAAGPFPPVPAVPAVHSFPFFDRDTLESSVAAGEHTRNRAFFCSTMAACALASSRVRDGALVSPERYTTDLLILPPEDFYAAAEDALPADPIDAHDFNYQMRKYIGTYFTILSIRQWHDETNWPSGLSAIEREEMRRLRPTPASKWLVGWNFTTDLYRILEHALSRLRTQHSRFNLFRSEEAITTNSPAGGAMGSANRYILQRVDSLYTTLPPIFKELRPATGNIATDIYGFQAANIKPPSPCSGWCSSRLKSPPT
ncbi:unnamed protein product [Parascedosporium putredinis]|uniref:Zn(2)-C6 fungal-type domain-containing protein n=1 Tax=Parascedosporium putredinis TaxID=1442378 RepID=A0A9P1HEH5_9PEZI|nr:unnamed protein product [Parascedosporium putredinis]CAI8004998.1 unnamed protein product [Parascedosporium putredinis]